MNTLPTTQKSQNSLLHFFYSLCFVLLFANIGWGQTTTVFSEPFTGTLNTLTTSATVPTLTYTSNLGQTGSTSGAAYMNGTQLQIENGNNATAASNVGGFGYVRGASSSFSSPYSTTLENNPGTVTWSCNMRSGRSSKLSSNGLSNNSSYSAAVILACDNVNPATAGSKGYALVEMGGTTLNKFAIVYFSDGIISSTNANFVTICSTADAGTAIRNYFSLKVTFVPSTKGWTLSFRDDGTTAFALPLSTATSYDSTVSSNTNSTATNVSMPNFAFLWKYSTQQLQTMYFDNFQVTVASTSPALTFPTAASITSTSATLGATVAAGSPATLTSRGTLIKTSTGVTYSDGLLADGTNTATGLFTHSRTGLSPETLYYYKGYATNIASTSTYAGLSTESSFRTLSSPPSGQATLMSGSASSNSQVALSWTGATFPSTGATSKGYILLRTSGTNFPGYTATNGTDLIVDANTTLVSQTISSTATTYSNTGLGGLTTYNYLLIPYTYDGTNSATYNYLTTSAPTAAVTTLSALPDAPTIGTASATGVSGQAQVSFTAPSNGGGSAITTYTATSSPEGITGTVSQAGSGSITVSGLTDGTAYTFTVTATNTAGTGVSSGASNSITPNATSTPQTISFGALSAVTYGDASFTLGASATSGLTVTYSSNNTSVATVSGNTVTIVGAGSATITASQAGDSTYAIATPVNQTLVVNQKALSITTAGIASKTYDTLATPGTVTPGTLSGFIGIETVTATATGLYTNSNVGTGKSATITYTLANGTNNGKAANYSLANGIATGDITQAPLTITGAVANNKAADGITTATLSATGSLSGVLSADSGNVTLVSAGYSANFADATVGTAKTVTITGYTITGSAEANYSLSQPTGVTANITTPTTFYFVPSSGTNFNSVSNWWSNSNGSGANPLNLTAAGSTYNVYANATTTAALTLGSGSKIVVGNSAIAGVTLTIASGFTITGTIDATVAQSGSNSIVLLDTTLPTFGALHGTSEVHLQATTSLTLNPTNGFGKLFIDGGTNTVNNNITGSTIIQTLLQVNEGSKLSTSATAANYITVNSGGNVIINGTLLVSKARGLTVYASGTTTTGQTGGAIQFFGTENNLTLGASSTVEYNKGTNVSAYTITGRSYVNLTITGLDNNKPIGTGTSVSGTLTLNVTGTSVVTGFANVTMGNGATIVRTSGVFDAAPTFGSTVNVTYNGTAAQTSSFEIPVTTSILNNLTTNNAVGVTLGANTTVNGTFTNSGIFNQNTFTLAVVGNLNNSGTITQGAAAAMTVGGTFANTAGTFTQNSGALTVTGAFSNGATFVQSNSGTTSLKGNVTNTGTLTQGNGTITLNGSASQTYSNSGTCNFSNLTIDNAAGVSLSSDLNVNGALTLTSGKITTGSNALVLGASGSVSRTSGHVAGNFRKNLTTASTTVDYEVGDALNYRPINLTFASISAGGSVTASVTQTAGAHPQLSNSLIDSAKRVDRYYTLSSADGLTFSTASATFTFIAADVLNSAATGSFIVEKYAASSWTHPTVGTLTDTSSQATGLTSFGDFAIGEASAIPLLTISSSLASFGNVCVNTTTTPNTFAITGANLTADAVTVGPNAGYTFSKDNSTYSSDLSYTQSGGAFLETVYVKFNPTVVQSYGNITVSGGGVASAISATSTAIGVNTAVAVANASNTLSYATATIGGTYTVGCSAVTEYGIFYSTVSGFADGAGTKITASGGTSFTVSLSGLTPNTAYYYKVFATDEGTTYSSQYTFTTTNLDAPTATAGTDLSSTGFTANWNAVTGATNYLLNVYAQENIVAWTFPISGATLTADVTSTNNTTNAISLSSGTIASASGVTTFAASTTTWSSGKYWEVSVNTTGYKDILVSSAQYSSGSGPRDFKLQYRVGSNTGTFTDVTGGAVVTASNFTTPTAFLNKVALPTDCDNQSVVYLRWTCSSNLRSDQTTVGNTIATGGTSRIDDIYISGGKNLTNYNPLTVSGTSQAVTGLTSNTTYYYQAQANSSLSTSVRSNIIPVTTYIEESVADYRSKASGNFSDASTWEFNNGLTWTSATIAPASTNNILIQAADTVALTADITVNTPKILTLNGTINLAGKIVSGTGNFLSTSGSTIKLGDILNLTTAIITSSKTLHAAANYYYDGTIAQTTGSLPSPMTGILTIANAAGVTITDKVFNSPGGVVVTNSGKLSFGGGTLNSTYYTSGTGSFSAATGTTLVITATEGIANDGLTGSIRQIGTRSFASGVNYDFTKNDGLNSSNLGTSFTVVAPALTPEIASINNLTINNPLSVILPANITVSGDLTFTSGILTTGSNTVTVNGTVTTVSTGWVNGKLAKPVTTATTAIDFEIGGATNYRPINITNATVTNAGTLTASVSGTDGNHPNLSSSTLNTAKSLARYFTLTNNGAVATYDATFNFKAADVIGGATTSYYSIGNYAASAWTYPTVGSALATSISATGLTTFGDFVVAEQTDLRLFSATALTVFGNQCINSTSTAKSFTLTGTNLTTSNVVVGPLAGYTFSTDDITYSNSLSLTQLGGSYSQLIYVKLSPLAVQSYSGNIPVSGGGAYAITVAASGSGVNTTVTVANGTTTTTDSFSANVAGTYTMGCSPVTAYGIEYSTTTGFADGTGTPIAGSGGASFISSITSGLTPLTTYYYKVYATDDSNETVYSSQFSFTTANLNAPVATAATLEGASGFTANWNAVTTATNYNLNVYQAGSSANIVGWTFPNIWTASANPIIADISNSSNNSTKLFSQSSGTITAETETTGFSARGASYYSTTGTAPNEVVLSAPNKYFQIEANTVGYSNIKVSSAQYSTSTGPKDFKLQYRVGNSGSFTDLTNITVDSDWTTGAVTNLVLPEACNNQTSIFIRWAQSSFTNVTGDQMLTAGGSSRIDNIYITGAALSSVSGYPTTVSGTSNACASLPSGTYYYSVTATDGTLTSAQSNLITANVVLDESIADFRTTASGDFSTSSIWEFNNGLTWNAATIAPTSSNNITIQSGHVVALTDNITVGAGKSMTVNGTINLASKTISGAGNFALASGATIKLGNSTSLATAITATSTYSTNANYFYDGTSVAQTTFGLPGLSVTTTTITGNVTVSNPMGVTLASGLKINTPGTLLITSTGKLLFGDGNVTSATIGSGVFSFSGTGSFTAQSGCSLSITNSKGICTGTSDGNIKNSGTRTFGTDINYTFAKNDLINASDMGTSFTVVAPALTPEITSINNLTINNPLTVTVPSNITVDGVLTLTSGNLVTGSNTVTLAATASIVRTNGHVVGSLKRNIPTSATSVAFEIGSTSTYRPVTLNFGSITTAGSITMNGTSGTVTHPNLGTSIINSAKTVTPYFTVTNTGLVFSTCSATFNFVSEDASGTPTNYVVGNYNGATWTYPTVSSATATSTTVTGLSAFGDFVIGEYNTSMSATALSAFANQCVNTTSAANTFTLSGVNTSGAISVASLSGFEFSLEGTEFLSSLTFTPSTGTFSQQIWVQFTPTLAQSYSGNSAISGGGATSFNVAVSGTGTAAPVITPPTSVATPTSTGVSVTGSYSQGCNPVTAYGLYYSTTNGFTNGTGTLVAGTGGADFTVVIANGLQSNTTYYYTLYATDGTTPVYGTQHSFTTLAGLATITTTAATGVTISAASTGGNLTNTGGNTINARGIVYGTSSSPTLENTVVVDGSTSTGTFVTSLSGLTNATTYFARAYATNGAGTAYGNEITFTTLAASSPVITTAAITSLTATSVTAGGNVTAVGDPAITERGIVYGSSLNPSISSNTKIADTEITTGAFTASITSLTPNTSYHVRAYATNSLTTVYGDDVLFTTAIALPTVTTTSISDVTTATASSGGTVSNAGGGTISTQGVCWSTSTEPTTALTTKTVDGTTSPFTSALTGLTSNTLYYFRAYATNSAGTAYGTEYSFTTVTIVAPAVTTTAISTVTSTTASSGGNVTDNGGAAITERGIVFGTSPSPTTADTKVTDGAASLGAFTSSLTGLTPNTTYYIRAYASNGTQTGYGEDVTFVTVAAAPIVTTAAITLLTATSATSGGNVTSDQGAAITERGIVYGSTLNPTTTSDTKITDEATTTGSFSSLLSVLTPNTTYHVRAYAMNSMGTSYGEDVLFTTAVDLPTVTTTAISAILSTTATSGGTVTNTGGGTITVQGVCWSTSTAPTTALATKTTDGTTSPFTSSITGLSPGDTYYVRAYATNSAGTSYGSEVTFTTPLVIPTLTTTAISAIATTTATSGGTVTSNGGAAITTQGVCWGTTTAPTIALTTKTTDGTSSPFTSSITGLYGNTTYYVRAYATNSVGTSYGNEVSFLTAVGLPVVTTTPPSPSATTARSGGAIYTQGTAVTSYGVAYGTSINPTIAGTKVNVVAAPTNGASYNSTIPSLTTGTTYYVRAYANHAGGTVYGDNYSFVAKNITSLQVIGQNPLHDGGFEGQATGAIGASNGTATSNYWNTNGGAIGTILNTGGRSGAKFANISYSLGSTSSPNIRSAPQGPAMTASTKKYVQFWYIGNKNETGYNANSTFKGGIGYQDAVPSSQTIYSAVYTQSATTTTSTAVTLAAANAYIQVGQLVSGTGVPSNTSVSAINGTTLTLSQATTTAATVTLSFFNPVATTWTKFSAELLSAAAGTAVSEIISAKMVGTTPISFDFDDVVVYDGPEDTTAPNSPNGTPTSVMIQPATIKVDWTAASGGVDGGGYVLVRYATNPNADNDPNQNGIYAIGNTITNGTDSLTGTVRYIGSALTFNDVDATLTDGTTYYYKVYTVDKAFNYSAEVTTSGTMYAPTATAYYFVPGSGTDVNDVNNWWVNSAGTGSHPANLTATTTTYYMYNSGATTAAWTLGGSGVTASKIVVGNGSATNFTISAGFPVTGIVDAAASATVTVTAATLPTFGTLNATSTVDIKYAGTLNIPTIQTFAGNLSVTGATTVVTTPSAGGTITVGGNFTIANGAFYKIDNTVTSAISIAGNFTASGTGGTTFINGANSATVTLTGSEKTLNNTASGNDFSKSNFNITGSYTLANNFNYKTSNTVSRALTIGASGSLNLNGYKLSLDNGNTVVTSPTIVLTSGTGVINTSVAGSTIEFYGSSIQVIPTAISYNNLILTGTSKAVATGTLTVSSTLTVNAGATYDGVTNNPTATIANIVNLGTFNQGTGTATISGNLSNSGTFAQGTAATMNVAGTFTNTTGTFTQNTGALTVNGAFSNSASFVQTNLGTTSLKGNVTTTSTGTLTQGTGTITLNGTASQTFTNANSCNFSNLTINNATGISLASDLNVNGVLTFTSGNITTGSNAVVLGASGSVTRTSGHVAGNFKKNLTTATTAITYEIGDATIYRPIDLSFASISANGSVTAKVSQTAGVHPNLSNSLIDATKSVNRYYTLSSADGLVYTTSSAAFNFDSSDVLNSSTTDTNNFMISRYAAGTWTNPTVGTLSGTSSQATGLSSFGDFAIGEAAVNPLLTSSTLAGFGSPCLNTTSTAHTFTITGTNLTSADVTVGPLTGFTFSTDGTTYSNSLSLTQSGGPYTQLIYVIFNPTVVQAYGAIPVAGAGAAAISVPTGVVAVNPPVSVALGTPSAITGGSATLAGTYTALCSTVSSYGIVYSTSAGFSTGTTVSGTGGATFTSNVDGLAPLTTYYYKVFATDDTPTTAYSAESSFVTTGLGVPTAIAATAITETSLTANWNAVPGAEDYLLNVYTAPVENIVGWTFPIAIPATNQLASLTADITSANNLTNTISQSSGTIGSNTGVTTYAIACGSWQTAIGKYWEVQANTLGYRAVKVSSKLFSTSPRDFRLEYKIGASGTYAAVPSGTITITTASDWNAGILNNLELPAACNNQASVYLRWINYTNIDITTGSAMTGGTARLDDVIISGGKVNYLSGYNPMTVSGTTEDITGLTTNTTYYYDVAAHSTASTSAVSNVITTTTEAAQAVANYRTKATGDFSDVATWEYNSVGSTWVAATLLPTSANNTTILASHTVALTGTVTVDAGKTMTVNGTINLAGYSVSGLGSFTVTSGATIKLGNTTSLTAGISSTLTSTINPAANYFYDGTTVAQTTAGLYSNVVYTGNVTVSNPTGVTIADNIKLNTPGTLAVIGTGKLLFGDGNVVDTVTPVFGNGTFSYSGTGNFSAATGTTLVITSSKGICQGISNGNIKNSGTRTFASGINYVFAKNDAIVGFPGNPISIGDSFGTEISKTTGIANMTIDNPKDVYLSIQGTITYSTSPVTTSSIMTTPYVANTNLTDGLTINGELKFVRGKLITSNYSTTSSIQTINSSGDPSKTTVTAIIAGSTTSVPVIIPSTGSITDASSVTGWVVGNLKRNVAVASTTMDLTIGDVTNYRPINLTFSDVTTAGSITANGTQGVGAHPQLSTSDINTTKALSRYFTITAADLSYTSCDATFNFVSSDIVGNATNYIVGNYGGTSWTYPSVQSANATSISVTDIGDFGDFAIGESKKSYWTGASSTTWSDSGNWSTGEVPTSISDVTIASGVTNQPTTSLTDDITVHSLTIQTGMTLTLVTGSDLTVTDVITNEGTGTMVVQNNANLIQTNDVDNTGEITVNRNSAGLLRYDHTLWSSPVTGTQRLKDFSPATLHNRFYTYTTSTNAYVNTANASNSNATDLGFTNNLTFSPGKGYAIRASNAYSSTVATTFAGAFKGVPNNGDIPFSLVSQGLFNYNLVGNPYPSPIDVLDFLTANPTIGRTLYFYVHSYSMDATTGIFASGTNYITYLPFADGTSTVSACTQGPNHPIVQAPNGTIQVGQGFFVRAPSGGTLNFNNGMRTKNHGNQFMRTTQIEKHRIWLNLKTDTGTDINQMNISYIEGATQDVDTDFDGLAFGNVGSSLLSKLNGSNYAIQGRSLPFATNDVVPLAFKSAAVGNYMISLTETDGLFSESQDIFVRDNLMGIDHNIKVSPYTFASDAGTFDSRFELVYTQALGIPSTDFTPNSVIVYKNTDWFHVNTKGITMKEIQVYDVTGRLIFKQSDINATTTVLRGLTETNEVLFLKITSEDNVMVTVKVIN